MPTPDNLISSDLQTQIKIVCDMMLTVHYFDEANWLWMALSAPQTCKSQAAQTALLRACRIAHEFGFPRVSQWVAEKLG